jgi:hypothetical protein
MEAAFDAVKRQLFDQLHDVVRSKIFYVRPPPLSPCKGTLEAHTHPRWRLAPTLNTRLDTDDALRAHAGAGGGEQQQRLLGVC